ncbi:MAG: hypothetical protein EHM47_19125 [Ignavibacteriales bacterium]|nr:MAG: hypothetical protein EHM47_19125 [Ignavibacteriales bacterium]
MKKLFARILEWLSLNYGLVPSAVYSNLEDGKIIFRNSTNLSIGNTCNYASVISIKDEKIRMEFLSIGFQSYYQGHYSGDTWIPEIRINFNTDEIYPIVLKKSSEWIPLLNLLMTTDEYFNAETENLYNYITTFDYLNNF